MGMYTSLDCEFKVSRAGTSRAFVNVLRSIIAWEKENENDFFTHDKISNAPVHPFFFTERVGFITHSIREIAPFHYEVVDVEVKNYDDCIGKFLDWISPYITDITGEYHYEESYAASDIRFIGGKIEIIAPEDRGSFYDWSY